MTTTQRVVKTPLTTPQRKTMAASTTSQRVVEIPTTTLWRTTTPQKRIL
jgi:hypothetical protein